MSREDVFLAVLAQHGYRGRAASPKGYWCTCGASETRLTAEQRHGKSNVAALHRAHLASVLAAAEPAAEQARAGALTEAEAAALERVRALAEPLGEYRPYAVVIGTETHLAVRLDDLRAALAGDAEHERSGT